MPSTAPDMRSRLSPGLGNSRGYQKASALVPLRTFTGVSSLGFLELLGTPAHALAIPLKDGFPRISGVSAFLLSKCPVRTNSQRGKSRHYLCLGGGFGGQNLSHEIEDVEKTRVRFLSVSALSGL